MASCCALRPHALSHSTQRVWWNTLLFVNDPQTSQRRRASRWTTNTRMPCFDPKHASFSFLFFFLELCIGSHWIALDHSLFVSKRVVVGIENPLQRQSVWWCRHAGIVPTGVSQLPRTFQQILHPFLVDPLPADIDGGSHNVADHLVEGAIQINIDTVAVVKEIPPPRGVLGIAMVRPSLAGVRFPHEFDSVDRPDRPHCHPRLFFILLQGSRKADKIVGSFEGFQDPLETSGIDAVPGKLPPVVPLRRIHGIPHRDAVGIELGGRRSHRVPVVNSGRDGAADIALHHCGNRPP
mmetsp:Transcript_5378/g.15617  ORF Transcript_5378/g.15617 Transcript_5378/m.15617 type:complete len:294 (-) Transcript_5378:147-1028(-)